MLAISEILEGLNVSLLNRPVILLHRPT